MSPCCGSFERQSGNVFIKITPVGSLHCLQKKLQKHLKKTGYFHKIVSLNLNYIGITPQPPTSSNMVPKEIWSFWNSAHSLPLWGDKFLTWSSCHGSSHFQGIEFAVAIAFNPSKWLMVHFDCTAMWSVQLSYLCSSIIIRIIYYCT